MGPKVTVRSREHWQLLQLYLSAKVDYSLILEVLSGTVRRSCAWKSKAHYVRSQFRTIFQQIKIFLAGSIPLQFSLNMR